MSSPLHVIAAPAQAASLFDPARRALLEHLGEPDSAAGLARRLGQPRQRINYHLRLLERDGLVEQVAERRRGNCVERLMQATARAFLISPEALGALGPSPGASRDRLSAAYLMTASARTIGNVARLEARARRQGKRLATLTLEGEVRFASARDRAAFAEELTTAVARLAARYHDTTARDGRVFRFVAAVHPAVSPSDGGQDHA